MCCAVQASAIHPGFFCVECCERMFHGMFQEWFGKLYESTQRERRAMGMVEAGSEDFPPVGKHPHELPGSWITQCRDIALGDCRLSGGGVMDDEWVLVPQERDGFGSTRTSDTAGRTHGNAVRAGRVSHQGTGGGVMDHEDSDLSVLLLCSVTRVAPFGQVFCLRVQRSGSRGKRKNVTKWKCRPHRRLTTSNSFKNRESATAQQRGSSD